ncbi:MAG: putative polymerase delta subunit [Bacillales bacterium]|jgi:DNA polymerase-3 subunit delta|nr:putative polymerase delta subunit [Bacillales bacterium]
MNLLIDNIILLYGLENYIINERINFYTNKFLSDEDKEFNLITYDMQETSIEVAIEDAETMPFFGDYKVIILRNSKFLTGEKHKIEQNLDLLISYIENPSPYTILIIETPNEKLDERKKVVKRIKELAKVHECNQLSIHELEKWILSECQRNGVNISTDTINNIIDRVGQNITMIRNELQKCFLFLHNDKEKEITDKLINELMSRSLEDNVFVLTDYITAYKVTDALQALSDLRKQNIEAQIIVGVLASHLRLLLQVKTLMEKGYAQNQLMNMLNLKPFRLKKAMQIVQTKKLDELKLWLMKLSEVDMGVKRGPSSPYSYLELYILSFSRR